MLHKIHLVISIEILSLLKISTKYSPKETTTSIPKKKVAKNLNYKNLGPKYDVIII